MKPGIPKGTRDFIPSEVYRRQYIFDIIKTLFERYGYQPIETPVMENLETLTGKYGDEGDKLLFKVLNNGDFLSKADKDALSRLDSQKLVHSIARRGLRYDLTVPFARFVTMHQHEITMPFKRYAIQPVWRADRPQKGRYQEFYQCDVDVVGTDSLICEAEYLRIIDQVFKNLGLDVVIYLNNRKILAGIAEEIGTPDRLNEMTVIIDKMDKIGEEGVHKELSRMEFSESQITRLLSLLSMDDLQTMQDSLKGSEIGQKGISEMQEVLSYLDGLYLHNEVVTKVSLARGLNYYTGCIFEVSAKDIEFGSLLGGGRYDNLTGVFGLKGVSGVGISFGVERIYDVMEMKDLFPSELDQSIKVLFVALDEASHKKAFFLAENCRMKGISCDVYPDPVKIKKQMKYADQIGVKHVVVIGSEELKSDKYTFRDMQSGNQELLGQDELIQKLLM